jgi:aspartyl-tRNA(Asn)/glutamyl-tRNA(Gln) amidotransferase subunit A
VSDLDFRTATVADLAAAVRGGDLSARDLVAHALERIDALNPAVNAFTAVDGERAMADASALDARIAGGDDPGPLAGIPIGVKDNDDATGFVTTVGSAVHAGDPPATRDSVLVARLRAAGCIVVGKTNMPELGLRGESDNRTFGITRNPWSLDHTPGGSSGGSAAAIAAGMVPLATGSDGGGSIRIPSAVCGLTGLKPSLGRVPAADPGPPGWAMLSTKGPMARRAGDVALALDVVVGPHPHDIRSLPAKPEAWAPAPGGDVELPRRIGWAPTLGYAEVDAEVLAVCGALVERCADAGAEVVEIDHVFSVDPGIALGTLVQNYIRRSVEHLRGTEWWTKLDPLVIVAAELGAVVARDPVALVRAEDACHLTNLELVAAMEGVDVLLAPTTRAVTAECERVMTVEELLAELGTAGLVDAAEDLGIDLSQVEAIIDAVRAAGPLNMPAGRCNGQLVPNWHGMTQAFNMTRTPAGTTCAGFTGDGLPIGIQVVGRQHDDLGVLRALAALERVSGVLDQVPSISRSNGLT